MSGLPKRLLTRIQAVTDKRPRTVLDHILEHGQITTQELRDLYGYNHPPRAAQEVKEHGIPLETIRVPGSDGRKIATLEEVPRLVAVWQTRRGQLNATLRWQFSAADARSKRRRLYPETREHNQLD